MLNNNNSAMENLYSVNYVENFLDVMENMPDEVQRDITKMRELDVNYQELLNDLDSIVKNFQSASSNEISAIKKILVELQDKLILSQELADDKIASVQHMLDVIEGKQTILETDQRKLGNECKIENERNDVSLNDRGDCERSAKRPRRTPRADVPSISSTASIAATISSAISNSTVSISNPQSSPSSSSSHNHGVDRLMRQDSPLSERGSNVVSSSSRGNSTRNSVQKRVVTKKKKRRSRMDKDREDSPPDMPIDPDEPTYCLCEQVSYGDMIGCDNDLCPIEWFHFSCVNLIHKPKGRWYCPKCRGDKATVMKPKSVLNKELMQYNKEKEERS